MIDSERHHLLFGRAALQFPGDLALTHHHDSVAHADDLGEVG